MSAPELAFSPMTIWDLRPVLAIERGSFSTPWSRDSFVYELDNKLALAQTVRLGDEIVGYLIGWNVADEFHLGNIAVKEEHRGRGIGSAILSRLLTNLAGDNNVMASLEVRETNQPAIGLYRKHGFTEVAIRKAYYSDTGENALVMVKYLDGSAD